MKSSLSKLKRIALHKSAEKEKMDAQPSLKFDELAQAAKDMQEMRNCYDSLLSAAAATANSAYEFSESLQEMGTFLLEKTAPNDDEESGKLLGNLGRVQLELKELLDSYRSHIFLTITNPAEILLSELRTVEDMKRQCDEKREVYEYMIAQQKEKGKSKGAKSECVTPQQLQAAQDEYEEEATLYAFRLKSLKQGQSRSLLTQAARHYAAQLSFFRKGVQSLEAAEPHVRMVTKQKHIEYQLSGLEGDGENDCEATEVEYKQGPDVSTSRNSTEVEETGSYVQATTTETSEASLDKGDLKVSTREHRFSSYSAPIFAEKKFDPADKVRQMATQSAAKSNAYVLPTPVDIKETNTTKLSHPGPRTSSSGRPHNLRHSASLDEKKERDCGDGKSSERPTRGAPSVLKESNIDATPTLLPRPSLEGLTPPQVDVFNALDNKKVKRQAYSGPLTSKPMLVKPPSSGNSVGLTETPPLVSGVHSRFSMPQPLSPKSSSSAVPPFVASSRMSELHELPRPPNNQFTKPAKSTQVAHSAPLVSRNQEGSASNRIPSAASTAASPLPTPPLTVPRSFSIPPSSQRGISLHVAKILDTSQVPEKAEVVSPPLSPISLADSDRVPSISDMSSRSNEIQVDAGGS
ncbi:hypothetical protein K1719_008443 [Acacia pycnantha]|nr:hypothetical protein K1719_008443 [Acacia pycnantha]